MWLCMTMPRDQITAALKILCFSRLGDPHLYVIIKCNVRVFLKENFAQLTLTIDNIIKHRYVHVELRLGGCGKGNLRTSSETCNFGCTLTVTYIM